MAYAVLGAFVRERGTRVQSLPEVSLSASVNAEFGLDLPSASPSLPERQMNWHKTVTMQSGRHIFRIPGVTVAHDLRRPDPRQSYAGAHAD